jgi:hypothetical protein
MLRAMDLWMTHATVVKELDDSFDQAEQGKTQGAVELEPFLKRLPK